MQQHETTSFSKMILMLVNVDPQTHALHQTLWQTLQEKLVWVVHQYSKGDAAKAP